VEDVVYNRHYFPVRYSVTRKDLAGPGVTLGVEDLSTVATVFGTVLSNK
jgi:hypothetical protein